jgi:hypothetical protein
MRINEVLKFYETSEGYRLEVIDRNYRYFDYRYKSVLYRRFIDVKRYKAALYRFKVIDTFHFTKPSKQRLVKICCSLKSKNYFGWSTYYKKKDFF